MRKLTVTGFALTVIWLSIFVGILLFRSQDVSTLTLNEWGDFLAGATAPLALMWLVIGYLLQGLELRQNTEVLKLQQQELARQVAETAILAENSARQAVAAEQLAFVNKRESERIALIQAAEAQPVLRSLGGGTAPGGVVRMNMKNVGATVSNIEVICDDPTVTLTFRPMEVFESQSDGRLRIQGATRFPLRLQFRFTDRFGERRMQSLEIPTPGTLRTLETESGVG